MGDVQEQGSWLGQLTSQAIRNSNSASSEAGFSSCAWVRRVGTATCDASRCNEEPLALHMRHAGKRVSRAGSTS